MAAFVSNNSLPPGDLASLISSVHASIGALQNGSAPAAATVTVPATPAVPIKKSVTRDFLICLDEGKKFTSLRRHLAQLGMTPGQYRAKWGLPMDYFMVAPAYSEKRSALAKASGLGERRSAARSAEAEAVKAGT